MFVSTKLLPVLALVVSLAPIAAQARNADAAHMAPACWATDFGFQPSNCKPAACKDVQKGFWPRPNACAR